MLVFLYFFFFFNQKTAFERRISDWSSDVFSSDLFWTIERGRIWQKRLMKEWLYVREKSKKARAAVSMRKDRRGYERNTNVGTNDLHLGGGGGEGEGVLSGNRELVSRE